MPAPSPALVVPHRFRGPAASGNGGWTSGALSTWLPGAPAVSVRLSAPPPLEAPMEVTVSLVDGGGGRRAALASTAGRVVLAATEVDDDIPALDGVEWAVAVAAEARYGGLQDHPFPECFSCGTGRSAGDGLALRPGRVTGDAVTDVVATTWQPAPGHADDAGESEHGGIVSVPITWAALDCPGGWSVDLAGRPMVLGTMTAAVDRVPRVGERCVVVGRCDAFDGRKARTTSTLRGGDGDVLGRARAVWIAVDPASVRPREAELEEPEASRTTG